jgi:rRNA maturation endonuclease Nob1
MSQERRLVLAACVGLALMLAAGVSDFVIGSFWSQHAMLTSLVANVLVVAITLAVVNEFVERRDRRRWNLLAQSVLFALTQSARATWSGLVEVLRLGEVHSGTVQPLLEGAAVARDTERVSQAIRELLADEQRRAVLQRVTVTQADYASQVIARWASVMVNASPYATVLNRHVELAGRLEWLSSVLTHNEPPEGQSTRDRVLVRSNVASEHAEEFGGDEWLHDQILAVINLATELDYGSRELAYSIVPLSWWAERTAGLAGNESPPAPLGEQGSA